MITKPSRHCTGKAFLREDVLPEGVTDFDRYADQAGAEPQANLFADHAQQGPAGRTGLREGPDAGDGAADDERLHGLGASKVWMASRSTMCRMTW